MQPTGRARKNRSFPDKENERRHNNKGLGVIGETLFYTALIHDTCVAQDTLFSFGKYGTAPDTSDAVAIKNGGKKFSKLMTHILAEKFHPLFTNSVADLIGDGLKTMGIGFNRALYDYEKKDFVDADNDL